MAWIILKNIFLGLFGFGVIAGFLTVVSHFDTDMLTDDFIINYISFTWYGFIVFKTFAEYYVKRP